MNATTAAIARRAALGYRQAALVEELLSEPSVPLRDVIVPGRWFNMPSIKVGRANVDWRSWRNLRRRLEAAGFRVERLSPRSIALIEPPASVYLAPVIPGLRVFEASWLPFESSTGFVVTEDGLRQVVVHTWAASHAMYVSAAFAAALRAEQ